MFGAVRRKKSEAPCIAGASQHNFLALSGLTVRKSGFIARLVGADLGGVL